MSKKSQFFITTTGYYGTGSSAITDLLSEYENILSLTDYEFRFIQDPDGISDLEFNLVENNHRHNSGYAIKKYQRLVKFLNGGKIIKKYNKFFGKHWLLESNDYIDNLVDFKYVGYWHQDVKDKGAWFYFRKRFFNKILQKTIWKNQERSLKELPKEITYNSYPSEEKFLEVTKNYINNLFSRLNIENKDYIMVDQIVATTNIERYTRYFANIKVFLVDRDPRDLYLLEKYVWKSGVIPSKDIKVFSKWYKMSRKHRETEHYNSNVMFLYFEDLVYKYDETVQKIENWLGLENNNEKKLSVFNPEESRKNTRLWNKYSNESENIKYLEKELEDYLYE